MQNQKSSTSLAATPAVGVEAAYQHYWLKNLRSSAVYSYAAVNNTAFFASAAPGTYNPRNVHWFQLDLEPLWVPQYWGRVSLRLGDGAERVKSKCAAHSI